jgi:hypothetical protein
LTEPRWADRARRSYTGPRRGSSMLRWLEGAEMGRGGLDRGRVDLDGAETDWIEAEIDQIWV